jgi:hypothetical protein
VAIPEFVQHVAEIQLGMFDSRTTAHAFANSPVRWGFGYAKLTGLVFAVLLTTRFWAKGASLRETLRIGPVTLLRIVLVAAVMVLSGGAISWLGERLLPAAEIGFTILSALLQAGILVWLIGIVSDDPAISPAQALSSHWPTAALVVILFMTAFGPGQLVHALDHRLVLGQSRVLVWPVMAFDSLVVGLMATTIGAGFHVAYRAAPRWSGWRMNPWASQ